MVLGAVAEPALVLALLLGGTIVNRDTRHEDKDAVDWREKRAVTRSRHVSPDGMDGAPESQELLGSRTVSWPSPSPRSSSPSEDDCRQHHLSFLVWSVPVQLRDTRAFRHRLPSRLLRRFPFLIEVWYWILIYWVYQLGRAFTAVTLVESTVQVARRHALQLIHLEKRLDIFWEPVVQAALIAHPSLMRWINRVYSYVHIPASIFFLVWLYYVTTACSRPGSARSKARPAAPMLYEARRRTMAMSNLLAFVVFTAWPCMPPRLLSDKTVGGVVGAESRSYGFVDTVHGEQDESSVWTRNRFCNQYAAMPSLHFGYALLIGVTVATIPLQGQSRRRAAIHLPLGLRLRLPSLARLACVLVGLSYCSTILVAIIATANHFILDAVAGAIVCLLGWLGNEMILNLLPLENILLWLLRIHKPGKYAVAIDADNGPSPTIVVEDAGRGSPC